MLENETGAISPHDATGFIGKCTDLAEQVQTFHKYHIKVTDEFTEPKPVVSQGDRHIVSRGNIATITGKPKAFKTFLISAIVAAFLEDEFLGISGCGGIAMIIDTEQGKSHVNNVQKRIYRLCEWDLDTPKENLYMLSLRELDAENRLKMAREAITEIKPDLVIIDGIRDMAKDFNDIKESSSLVGTLMTISTEQDCAIISILHQNKADTNARGHLGSELCNKSETVLQVENTDGIATVSPVYSRNREIEPFSFRVNVDGLPVGCSIPKVEKKRSEVEDLFKRAMFGQALWKKEILIPQLAAYSGKSEKTASRRLQDALSWGIVKISKAGTYYLASLAEDTEDLPLNI